MTSTRRSAALTCVAALLAGGTAVAASPAASAAPPGEVRTSPAWDVPMAYPLGGVHTMRFGALTSCVRGEGDTWHQAISANAWDVDQPIGSFDFSAAMFPFNSADITWENRANGRTGRHTVHTTGREVGIGSTITGRGDVLVTITVSRSALPTLSPGSVAPFVSDTRTERFLVRDNTSCV